MPNRPPNCLLPAHAADDRPGPDRRPWPRAATAICKNSAAARRVVAGPLDPQMGRRQAPVGQPAVERAARKAKRRDHLRHARPDAASPAEQTQDHVAVAVHRLGQALHHQVGAQRPAAGRGSARRTCCRSVARCRGGGRFRPGPRCRRLPRAGWRSSRPAAASCSALRPLRSRPGRTYRPSSSRSPAASPRRRRAGSVLPYSRLPMHRVVAGLQAARACATARAPMPEAVIAARSAACNWRHFSASRYALGWPSR